MRKIIILISFIISTWAFSTYSQQVDKQYLFPEFKTATIHFNSGNTITEKMNFNIVYRQMIYQKENNLLALSNDDIKTISKIEIDNRTFVPFEKGVCELISIEPYIVAEYNSRMKPESVDMGRGASTTTSAASRVSHIISGTGNFQELKNLDIQEADLMISYYITVKGQLKKVRNVKQLKRLFPKHKNKIEEILTDNKAFNFNNTNDFKLLYTLIYELM